MAKKSSKKPPKKRASKYEEKVKINMTFDKALKLLFTTKKPHKKP